MPLTPIPNQQFFFGTRNETQNCKKNDPACLLIQDGDDIFIQFLNTPCDTASLLCDSYFSGLTDDLVTNGDFDGNASGWTLGGTWTYNAGAVDVLNAGSNPPLSQNIASIVEDQCYLLTFQISNYVSGSVTPRVGGTLGSAVSADGTYRQLIVAGATAQILFIATDPAEMSIDKITLHDLGPCWCADNGSISVDAENDEICHIPGEETTLSVVNTLPDINNGSVYKVVVNIPTATAGTVHVIVGATAVSMDFEGAGTFTDYVTADGDDNFQIVFSEDSDACVHSAEVVLMSQDHNFGLINPSDVNVMNLNPFVTYYRNRVFIKLNTADFDSVDYGCYRIVAEDICALEFIDSNCFNYQAEHANTRLITAIDIEQGDDISVDRYSFGFLWNPLMFLLQLRVEAEFRKPTQDSKLISDRFSTGRYFKSYVEQSKKWELAVVHLDETQHDCLALMLKCKTLTIDGQEYFNDEEEYSPLWDDKGYNNTADVKITVRKKDGVIFSDNCNR